MQEQKQAPKRRASCWIVDENDHVRVDRRFSYLPQDLIDAVHACVRGSYQKDLLDGRETWSGSSLKSTARSYGKSYAESRRSLLDRIRYVLPFNWQATTELVLSGSPRRWRRELILHRPDGVRLVW